VRVAVEGGEVRDFASECDEGRHASARLHLTDAAEIAGYRVAGGVKIAARDEGSLFKVCVEGLHAGDVIEILVAEASAGTATADGEGRGCLVLENVLPVGELAGARIDVYLFGTDLRLLVGEVPELMEERDEGDRPDGSDDRDDEGDRPDEGDEPGDDDREDGDRPDGSDDGDDEGDRPDEGGDEPDQGGDDTDRPGDDSDEPNDEGTGSEGDDEADGGDAEEGRDAA
jgi:hypothetical protein